MSEDANFRANYLEGINKFNGARAQRFWRELASLLRGQSTELLSFEDIRARLRLRAESYRGLQDIEVAKIVGSVGRYNDFTRDFLPRSNEMRERWSRVYASMNSMVGVPPIEVYKVGDVYFVRDGNHRVSVARQLGAETIQAHVTELPTSFNIDSTITEKDLDELTDYAAFLDETGLSLTRPHHQSLKLSEPSRYPELLGHIHLHAQVLEHQRGMPVTLQEAASHWYDTLYRPALTLIRKYNIVDAIKDSERTEADVFLWMVDHLREARRQLGEETNTRTFSHALVDYLTEKKLPIPPELLQEDDDSVMLTRTQVLRAVQHHQDQNEETPPESGG